MTKPRRGLLLGSAALIALLAALIVPNFRRGAASLSHPDPVGPTAYSKSAIGHLAFFRLLEELDIPVTISESGSGGHVGPGDVLVIAEPRDDDATLGEVRVMLTARTVLLVLPKRVGEPDPDRPYWMAKDKLVAPENAAAVLHMVDKDATLVRAPSLTSVSGVPAIAGSPAIQKPQLVRSKVLRPLVASADGILIGERRTSTGRVFVLSDPDLIANYALARGDNSVVAVSLIEHLRGEKNDGEVIFDEFVHGFSPKPFHLLGILFQFPFILVTAQMGVAVLLLAWAATGRFGAPTPVAEPLAAGKRSLIDTGARLLTHAGRIPDISERYYEAVVRDTGRRMRAARGLDLPAVLAWLSQAPGAPSAPTGIAAPQQIWKWRKSLLGESRSHSQLD